jgi:hypothetical protein
MNLFYFVSQKVGKPNISPILRILVKRLLHLLEVQLGLLLFLLQQLLVLAVGFLTALKLLVGIHRTGLAEDHLFLQKIFLRPDLCLDSLLTSEALHDCCDNEFLNELVCLESIRALHSVWDRDIVFHEMERVQQEQEEEAVLPLHYYCCYLLFAVAQNRD